MDDTRQFLEDAAAAEEPEVLGHLRAEMSRIRATTSAKETPFGDVGKVPSAAKLLNTKQPDDWLIDQFGMRGSLVVLGGATGASKSTLVYGMAQAISTGGTWGGQLQCKQGNALVIQSDESERNAQRKLQVMDMDPSFDLLTDMPELDLARLEALQQANRYDAIFMDSITTLLGMCGDGPKMTDVDFGFVLYELNKWADENNVLLVMTSHLRKQAKDAVSNNVPSNLTKGSGTGLSALIYGNFSDLLIGMFGQLEILVDPYTDFAKGTVGVRALQSIDIAVRHAESFAAMQDAIA